VQRSCGQRSENQHFGLPSTQSWLRKLGFILLAGREVENLDSLRAAYHLLNEEFRRIEDSPTGGLRRHLIAQNPTRSLEQSCGRKLDENICYVGTLFLTDMWCHNPDGLTCVLNQNGDSTRFGKSGLTAHLPITHSRTIGLRKQTFVFWREERHTSDSSLCELEASPDHGRQGWSLRKSSGTRASVKAHR
jgi:hypothetical protein